MKILLVTNTPPIPTWGGAMAFYRHFCLKNDFTVKVVTDDLLIHKYDLPYEFIFLDKGKFLEKLARTRFNKAVGTYVKLVGFKTIPDEVMKFAEDFRPDAIFTVAGSWNRMAILAGMLSEKMNVPLIASFNDWWYYNSLYYQWSGSFLEKKFKGMYKKCDLAICTSEGMKEELGGHKNAVVVYPTGATLGPSYPETDKNEKFTIAFAGNLGEWYGKMLESIGNQLKGEDVQIKIFGSNQSWSSEFDQYVRKEGIYKGQVSFAQLGEEMKKIDALILLMGFEEECALIEKTSFKTKFLDYLSFRKPILLWGPAYCSAVTVAREFNSAEICTSSDPADFAECVLKVRDDSQLQRSLVNNACKMYEDRFNPEIIHANLVKSIKDLMKK
jgi:glycosyltransferase involved in cell wall biosynthesis